MKLPSVITASILALTAASSHATLAMWQAEVGSGTATVSTVFDTVNGATPQMIDVGALSGDRSFEFIYNAAGGGASQALIGSQNGASGAQGLKVNQWNNTGMYGMTDFGVADHTSTAAYLIDQDVHIVFTSDAVDTTMYINGASAYTFAGVDLTVTGLTALGAASNPDGTAFFDNLAGNIYGFASYDSALSAAEVLSHYNAYAAAVPEAGTSGLLLLAGIAAARSRRRAR